MNKWLGLPSIEEFKGLDLMSLPLNRAYVIANTTIDTVGVYSVRTDCFQCPFKLMKNLKAGEEVSWEVDTTAQTSWKMMNFGNYGYVADNYRGGSICQENPTLGEFGVYRLKVGECALETEVPPINPLLPLLLCGLILLFLFIVISLVKSMFRFKKPESKDEKVLNIERAADKMKGLQLFRGLLMIIIIFATSGGGGYPIFTKKVGGLSIPEIAFYALVWTIGVRIPHAVDMELSRGKKKWVILGSICLRSIILIFASIVIDSSQMLSVTSDILWSPLKQIGYAYLIAACTYALTAKRIEKKFKMLIGKVFSTIITMVWSWVLFGVFLAILIICMSTLANFNCVNETGFKDQKANYSNKKLDVIVNCDNEYTVTVNKIFVDDSSGMLDVYGYFGYGAGLLGILSSVLYTFIGMKTGVILAHFESNSDKRKLLASWATFFGFVGLAVAVTPLSLNLWPFASILLISTISTYVLMLIYYRTENQQSDSPISSLGASHLPILFCHLLIAKTPPFSFCNSVNSHFWYLVQNVWTVILWVIIGEVLVRRDLKTSV